MIECGNCGEAFEPVRTRWLCPSCRHKESCCEGEALPLPTAPAADSRP